MATPPKPTHTDAPKHDPSKHPAGASRHEPPGQPSFDNPSTHHADQEKKAEGHEGHREHEGQEHHEGHKDKSAKDEQPKYPVLEADKAYTLFYNGHRIVKDGDPPEKWISMSRLGDSTAVVHSPMTPELEKAIREGQWYHADPDALNVPAPPPAPSADAPTVVNTPHVSLNGEQANCTMGNWTGEPTSYAYAWQRDGAPISGATSADYTMVSADSGKPVGCIVTATNAAGSTAAPLSNTIIGP